MACAPTSCSNSDVARNTAARDCSLRGRPRRICADASGELLNVVFICLTIDYFPGLATARLGGGLPVVTGCGFFAGDGVTRSVRRSWSGCGCIPLVRSRVSLPGGCPPGAVPAVCALEGADAAFASG